MIALGGGGARGLAHAGVFQVLETLSIPVAGVAGTSAGAVLGAMWLTLGSADAVISRWRDFLASDFPDSLPDIRLADTVSTRDSLLLHYARRLRRGAAVIMALDRRGLVKAEELREAIAFLVPDVAIEDLPTAFCAVATDFRTGAPVCLRRGSLIDAVAASSAIPGVLPPHPIGGQWLVDGGVVAEVPVRAARTLGHGPVIAVDVGESIHDEEPETITVPRAVLRAGIMTARALREKQLAGADLVLRPQVGELHWSDFRQLDEAVEAGSRAAGRAGRRLRVLGKSRQAPHPPWPALGAPRA